MIPSSSLKEKHLPVESLEPRQMLDGIAGWNDVPLAQQDIAAAMATVLKGQGEHALVSGQWDTLPDYLAGNESLTPLFETSGFFLREQGQLKVAEARTGFLQSHIAEETALKKHLEEESMQKTTLLADTRAALQECRDAQSGLKAETQRLSMLVTTLEAERTQIPGQISALNTQIADDQKTLSDTAAQRTQAEKKLAPLQKNYATAQKDHNKWHAYAAKYPQNKMFQTKDQKAEQKLADLGKKMQPYQDTIAACTAKETALHADILRNQHEVQRLQARQAALPGESAQTQDQLKIAQAALDANRAEESRLQTEAEYRQTAVDAAMAEEGAAAAHLTGDQTDLLSLLAQERSERSDVETIHAIVDSAIAQVLAEGDPPLPAAEPEEEAEPQILQENVHLAGLSPVNGLWTVDLPSLGGNISLHPWQGHAAYPPIVEPLTGTALRRALIEISLTTEAVNAQTPLSTQLHLQAGAQPEIGSPGYMVNETVDTAEFGRVTVNTDSYQGRQSYSPPLRYIYSSQNIVTASNLVGTSGGGVRADHLGEYRVNIGFADGPHYVQWVDVARLGGNAGLKLEYYRPDGSGVSLPITGGPVIIDDVIVGFGVSPNGSSPTTSSGIRSMNTDAVTIPEGNADTWLKTSGELVGVDLSQAGTAVSSADLSVRSSNPSNIIRAIAYRGETRLGEETVGPDGAVHWEDPAGITSILLVQSDPNALLYVTSMSVSGLEGTVPPASTDLTPMGNPEVGIISARQWEHGTFNWAQIAENNGVLRNRGGFENRVNGRILFHTGIAENSQTQYSRYDLYATSGSVGIAGLWYIDSDGLHRVPQEYWQAVAGNSFVTTPGGPKYLVLEITGNGTFDVGTRVADHATDVMPSQEMELRSTVLVVRKTGPAEGFCTVPPTVSSENAHATAGGTVNMFYQILNDGLGSGPITVRIHVGQTGTAADPVTREFTGELLRGLSTIGLSVDVTLQQDRDRATMEVLGPDGQSSLASWTVRPPHETNPEMPFGETGEYAVRRAGRAGRQAAGALDLANDPRTAAIWTARNTPNPHDRRLIADAAVRQVEEPTQKEELADASDLLAWDVEVGGIVVRNKETPICSDADWFNEAGYLAPGVRTDTAASRHFLGLVQRLIRHADNVAADPNGEAAKGIIFDPDFASVLYPALQEAQRVTGIPWMKIAKAADLSFSSNLSQENLRQRLVDDLKKLFSEAQYGEIFDTGRQLNSSEMAGVHVGRPSYTDADRAIRVRFDFTSPDKSYDRGNVYVITESGEQFPAEGMTPALLMDDFRGTLFVDVPTEKIIAAIPQSFTNRTLRLKVALWDEAGDTAGIQGRFTSESFTLEVKGHLAFSPQDVLGETAWNAVVAAGDQDLVRNALDFGNVGPEKNRQLITWLVDHYLSTASTEEHRMNYDSDTNSWAGEAYEQTGPQDRTGECKYWVQMDVIKNALGITLPNNETGTNASSWVASDIVQSLATETDGSLRDTLENSATTVQAGDMIQMASSNSSTSLHTVIIGKIDTDGIWVFDSNYGMPLTPRYHKISLDSLDDYDLFTIYRIK